MITLIENEKRIVEINSGFGTSPDTVFRVYRHGEFDFHLYSSVSGVTPADSLYYNSIPLSNADLNIDGKISIQEAYLWEVDHESTSETPVFSDLGNIASSTSFEFPTLLNSDINSKMSCRGLIGVSKEIHVTNTLTIADNAKITFLNNATIIVDEDASLIIGKNVKILGGENNKIIVYGTIQMDENSVIEPLASVSYFGGIEIQKASRIAHFINTSFNSSFFVSQGENLSVNNCRFDNCDNIQSFNGSVVISNCEFINSYLTISNQSSNQDYSATIQNCQFNATANQNAIEIQSYGNYTITGNTISHRVNGIQLFHAGNGLANSQIIANNVIKNCSAAGIILYNAMGTVENNRIENNYCGVKLLNGSNVSMVGNRDAADIFDTQLIKDNTTHQ
ncbi:MAG: hypothetical protein PHU27_10435, partial [Salinivirgaceae bacterium]|nr:hypothetical protein [Salinivirgaceae bacterium]